MVEMLRFWAERGPDYGIEKDSAPHGDASVYPENAVPERVHGLEAQFVNDIAGHEQAGGQSYG